MESSEEKLLARVTVNYLFLGQYETFRASVQTLWQKNPSIAIAILRAVLQKVGVIKGIAWSKSISSSSHLAWLALSHSLELQACLPPEKKESLLWGLNQRSLKLKLEALFLLHQIIKAVEAKIAFFAAKRAEEVSASPSPPPPSASTLELSSSDSHHATIDDPDISSLLNGSSQRTNASLDQSHDLTMEQPTWDESQVLKSIYNAWLAQLSLHLASASKSQKAEATPAHSDNLSLPELDNMSIQQKQSFQQAVVSEAKLFKALCWNLIKQTQLDRHPKPELSERDNAQDEGSKHLGRSEPHGFDFMLCQEVQGAFLAILKKKLEFSSLHECLKYFPLLQTEFGVPNSAYRDVIHAIMKMIMTRECGISKQDRLRTALFDLYEAIQGSGSSYLVSAVEFAQDSFLHEAAESYKASNESSLPPPLHCLHQCFRSLRKEDNLVSEDAGLNECAVLSYCMRQLCHYSRATGTHMFDTVMGAALFAVKTHQFQKAVDILAVFPRLQPLAAVIGWDLLVGDTVARRLMMESLWVNRSMESFPRSKHKNEFCCVDHLCDQLCYRLDLAYFAAHINSGLEWTMSFFLYPYQGQSKSNKKLVDTKPTNAFVANLVLERLAMHSPIRVLFDVVTDVNLKHARALLKMCPTTSAFTNCMRMQDLEVIELHFGVQAISLALGAMEKSMIDGGSIELGVLAMTILEELRDHLLSISNRPRRIFFMGIIVDLLHMDDASTQGLPSGLEVKLKSLLETRFDAARSENAKKVTTMDFVGRLLEILRECRFSSIVEVDDQKLECAFPRGFTNISGQKAWEWKNSNILHFVEDWEWRLAVLQRLAPSPHRQWQWKEALSVLRAAPSTLVNLCVQRAQYDLGEEAVHRFALPPEDEAVLQLAEWVDRAVARTSVDDAVSRVAEGASSPEEAINLATLRAPLAPIVNVLLCIDVAAASARTIDMSKQLLQKARSLLTEIASVSSSRQGSTQVEQIQEACILSVGKRVVQCLQDLLEKICMEKNQPLQSLLSGTDMINVVLETAKHGHRYRALNILQQTIEDAHNGKRQFLSGKLHNLVKALADEDIEENNLRPSVSYSEKKTSVVPENGFLLGYGIRGTSKQPMGTTSGVGGGDHVGETPFFPLKGTGKRYLGPLISKPLAYLSAFILYIATIGDIVDGVDTTHDFNFFTLVYERSNDLLTRLVFERGSANAAGKVAEIMGADLTQEVISACVPPIYPPRSSRGWASIPLLPSRFSSPDNQHERASNNVGEQDCGLYPLKLDVLKHLATLSPVRAILACVFGTSKFQKTSRPLDGNVEENGVPSTDMDRSLYELALEQSDRYSTLNRWIQTQANLQQLSEFPLSMKKGNIDGQQNVEGNKMFLKRSREHETDTDSEDDDEKRVSHGVQSSSHPIHESLERNRKGMVYESSSLTRNNSKIEGLETKNSTSLVFEWENESIYKDTVHRLLEEGKLVDALALADRYLRGGAPDYLLQLLIEDNDGGTAHAGQWLSHHNTWNISWQYCLRLRDKRLAASLALKHMRKWDLEAAIDVLTMCSCHLMENDLLHNEVLQLKQSLQLYSQILRADGRFTNWQEVENLCQKDPEELALRLAGKGAVSAALEVAERYKLREELRRELQGRQLVKLLTSDPVNGGGPAEALRFLVSLSNPEDALPVAMAAMEQLTSLQGKQLLVHFFLKKRVGVLSNDDLDRLNKLALGLQMLGALPLPWQQRCAALHRYPQLILETLLMWKQLQVASELLCAFPSLRDDGLILTYAAKAITAGVYPKYERRSSNAAVSSKFNRSTMSGRANVGGNAPVSKKESRRPFPWATRDTGNKITPKDVNRKRKSTALSASQKAAWDTISGGHEERLHTSVQENFERLTPFTVTEGWVLTGDPVKDNAVRDSHRYESAPCITLFKSLLGLCSSEEAAVKACVEICVKQMKQILNSEQLPPNASSETVEKAFYATEAFVQALLHAKVLLRKLLGSSDTPSIVEGQKESSYGDGSGQIQEIVHSDTELPKNLSELLFQVVEWLSRAELLQSLLGSGVTASLDDMLSKSAGENLRDRLVLGERYNMAVYCCTKCKVDAFPVWKAWAHALVQMEHYAQARVKLKQALKLHKGDPTLIVREIISTMEASPPVDIPSVRSLFDHMAKNAFTIMDDSLSADAYLNVLYMPSSFTKSERSRRTSEDSMDSFAAFASQPGGEEGPRSNLDRSRYDECIFYLQEYARQDLLPFMFKHCHYADACLLFFPPNAVPSPPVTTSPPQRSDPTATDFGSIDDLCELCVAYGAMPVLERVIATRELTSATQDPTISQHTAAALARVCTYCENHKHFNHLYRFQVLKKDHVAAGLCCIQLFLNSANQEQALRQLERAKTHFDEGFYARQQGGEVGKASMKATRGKSPSERFSEEELMKFSTRISTQMDVVRCFSDAEGPPWKHSLFGNPNDADTVKRRQEVVEALAEKNFDLAFRIIYDFGLPHVQIYAAVAASLAERKKGNQLSELLKNIKATISDDDLDQVIGAAIMVFANKHKERPDRLIELLSSSHRKVLSCVACGRLKTAFQIASRSGSIADVQYVSDQAKRTGVMSVVDMCKQWLSKQK